MKLPIGLKRFLIARGIDRETYPRHILHPLRTAIGHKGTLPSIMIIGAQKAGTTTLHNLLAQHPKVHQGLIKESHFFDKPENFKRGLKWYRALFPKVKSGEHTIDSTPMMYHEAIPELAAGIVPQTKIIMLLRDPVSRGFSHYLHNVARKRETLPFEEAVATEDTRIQHTAEDLKTENQRTYNYRAYSYLERGRYDTQLERWRTHFPAENIKVVIFEEFVKAPTETLTEILDWLDLDQIHIPESRPRNQKLLNETITPETDRALRERLAPNVERLETLIGRSTPWSYPKSKS